MTISNRTIPTPDQIGIERRDLHTLTKRERFAMAAMQGLLARRPTELCTAENVARWAVGYADALLAELAKEKPIDTKTAP